MFQRLRSHCEVNARLNVMQRTSLTWNLINIAWLLGFCISIIQWFRQLTNDVMSQVLYWHKVHAVIVLIGCTICHQGGDSTHVEDLCFCALAISTFSGLGSSLCELQGQSCCPFWQCWIMMFLPTQIIASVFTCNPWWTAFWSQLSQTDWKRHCQERTQNFCDFWFTTHLIRRNEGNKITQPDNTKGVPMSQKSNLNCRVQMEKNNTIFKPLNRNFWTEPF